MDAGTLDEVVVNSTPKPKPSDPILVENYYSFNLVSLQYMPGVVAEAMFLEAALEGEFNYFSEFCNSPTC